MRDIPLYIEVHSKVPQQIGLPRFKASSHGFLPGCILLKNKNKRPE